MCWIVKSRRTFAPASSTAAAASTAGIRVRVTVIVGVLISRYDVLYPGLASKILNAIGRGPRFASYRLVGLVAPFCDGSASIFWKIRHFLKTFPFSVVLLRSVNEDVDVTVLEDSPVRGSLGHSIPFAADGEYRLRVIPPKINDNADIAV
jgi:hypothetical protein